MGIVNVIPVLIRFSARAYVLSARFFFSLLFFCFAFRQPLFISFVPALPLSRFSRNRDYYSLSSS